MEFMQVKTDYLYFKNKWLWKKKKLKVIHRKKMN